MIKTARRETFAPAPAPSTLHERLATGRLYHDPNVRPSFVVRLGNISLERDIDKAIVDASPFLDFMVRSGTISRTKRSKARADR